MIKTETRQPRGRSHGHGQGAGHPGSRVSGPSPVMSSGNSDMAPHSASAVPPDFANFAPMSPGIAMPGDDFDFLFDLEADFAPPLDTGFWPSPGTGSTGLGTNTDYAESFQESLPSSIRGSVASFTSSVPSNMDDLPSSAVSLASLSPSTAPSTAPSAAASMLTLVDRRLSTEERRPSSRGPSPDERRGRIGGQPRVTKRPSRQTVKQKKSLIKSPPPLNPPAQSPPARGRNQTLLPYQAHLLRIGQTMPLHDHDQQQQRPQHPQYPHRAHPHQQHSLHQQHQHNGHGGLPRPGGQHFVNQQSPPGLAPGAMQTAAAATALFGDETPVANRSREWASTPLRGGLGSMGPPNAFAAAAAAAAINPVNAGNSSMSQTTPIRREPQSSPSTIMAAGSATVTRNGSTARAMVAPSPTPAARMHSSTKLVAAASESSPAKGVFSQEKKKEAARRAKGPKSIPEMSSSMTQFQVDLNPAPQQQRQRAPTQPLPPRSLAVGAAQAAAHPSAPSGMQPYYLPPANRAPAPQWWGPGPGSNMMNYIPAPNGPTAPRLAPNAPHQGPQMGQPPNHGGTQAHSGNGRPQSQAPQFAARASQAALAKQPSRQSLQQQQQLRARQSPVAPRSLLQGYRPALPNGPAYARVPQPPEDSLWTVLDASHFEPSPSRQPHGQQPHQSGQPGQPGQATQLGHAKQAHSGGPNNHSGQSRQPGQPGQTNQLSQLNQPSQPSHQAQQRMRDGSRSPHRSPQRHASQIFGHNMPRQELSSKLLHNVQSMPNMNGFAKGISPEGRMDSPPSGASVGASTPASSGMPGEAGELDEFGAAWDSELDLGTDGFDVMTLFKPEFEMS